MKDEPTLRDIADDGYLVIDVEGDGNHPARPVEIGIAECRQGRVISTHHWLINPGRPITEFVTRIHGISDDDVSRAPVIEHIADDISAVIRGRVLVAHAAGADLDMLRIGIPDIDFLPARIIDTVRIAKMILPEMSGHGLPRLTIALGLQEPEIGTRGREHSALRDALVTAQLFELLVARIEPKALKHISTSSTVTLSQQKLSKLRATLESPIGFKP